MGKCQPTDRCMIADVGCFKTDESCKAYDLEVAAAKECPGKSSCGDCTKENKLCAWNIQDKKCFMSANYWSALLSAMQFCCGLLLPC